EKVYQDLKKEGIVPDFICDNSHLKQGTFFKQHSISSPDDILLQNYDFIVVITSSYVEEIKLQLHKYNTIFDIYDLVESR
ncbi:hypothetical protein KKF31_08400, partial [bacterium]|nr:hypothetical protein [bacterium]